MSSNILDKYEYLTGEDLGLKQSTLEQAKFEYYPLGKFFNKRLKEEEKKEGLLKRQQILKIKMKSSLKQLKIKKKFKLKLLVRIKSNHLFQKVYTTKT